MSSSKELKDCASIFMTLLWVVHLFVTADEQFFVFTSFITGLKLKSYATRLLIGK